MTHEIRSSQFPHNMAAWCNEKAEHSLASIARALDEARSLVVRDGIEKDFLFMNFSFSIWDASKLLAFSCGAEWNPSDADIIFEQGYAGFEKVLVRYGLLNETSEDKRRKLRENFIHQLEILLDGDRTPNRTLLHELIAKNDLKHPKIDKLSDMLEKVTMGEVTWDVFVEDGRAYINEIRKELSDK